MEHLQMSQRRRDYARAHHVLRAEWKAGKIVVSDDGDSWSMVSGGVHRMTVIMFEA